MSRGLTSAAVTVMAAVLMTVVLAACTNPPDVTSAGTRSDECDEPREPQSLVSFAQACNAATQIDVRDFDCDAGTEVPETHLSGSYPYQLCDRPNVLNHQCDPGSRFQVLKQTNDAIAVAHCRKQDHGNGFYGDIAVIQYNQVNGATCFYQALGKLPAKVSAPIKGNLAPNFPWKDPRETAGIQCVQCHDNGPFVRSPYLAQLNVEATNRLPGTKSGPGRWDQRYSWNKTLPYMFVGDDFQSWKAYSISVTGVGSGCAGCHRLGIHSVAGTFGSNGTALTLGIEATAKAQAQKNPHSPDSPIWMTPGQITWDQGTEDEAHGVQACAKAIVAKQNDPSRPDPPAGCAFVQIARGSSCRSGAIRGTINGATQSTPRSDRSDTVVDIGACASGDCPIGYCYWRSVHGPFWQASAQSVSPDDLGWRGALLRIYSDGGLWKVRALVDPTGLAPQAPPGGTFECTAFNEIVKVPDAKNCGSSLHAIQDANGGTASGSVKIAGSESLYPLTGFIGNVAQVFGVREQGDVLQAKESAGAVHLAQRHSLSPPAPLKPGPLTGESWTSGCNAWSPDYVVKDQYTDGDIQLVAYPLSKDVRCFVTGVSGAWSSSRNGGKEQPFAEIYSGGAKEVRLRVSPSGPAEAKDRVGAYASCIRLR